MSQGQTLLDTVETALDHGLDVEDMLYGFTAQDLARVVSGSHRGDLLQETLSIARQQSEAAQNNHERTDYQIVAQFVLAKQFVLGHPPFAYSQDCPALSETELRAYTALRAGFQAAPEPAGQTA